MTTTLLRTIPLADLKRTLRPAVDAQTLASTAPMIDAMQRDGDAAALAMAERYGDLQPGAVYRYDQAALALAVDRIPQGSRDVLKRTAARITSFAQAQRRAINDLDIAIDDAQIGGARAGHTFLPVQTAGCYAPGGRFPLPSSVLMTVIPARVAGVERVWVCSPKPTDATLAAAAIAGADGLLAIGGVQAIGSMTFGLLGSPACDIIVGPGNRWVTAAKFLVSDRVGIDMLAGPSELVVLADETADPRLIAADLLAQAEHDDDALPVLVTTDPLLPVRVNAELAVQLECLPTRATASAALRNGYAVIAPDMKQAIAACDTLAPEHLEIMTSDAFAVAPRVRNAGAVFVGAAAAEVLGDYGAGPNHVLPTGGSARSRAGLSVLTFLRARTWLSISNPAAASALREDAASLGRIEGLEAHARAAELRQESRSCS